MSMALAEAGPAVTLTSLTSLCAFFLSAIFSTAMPGMMVFNLCMGVALLLNVLGFVFFFSAWLVLNEERIRDGLMDFHFPNYQVGPHAVPSWLKHKACKGKLPDVLDVGNKLRMIVTTRYAPFLAKSKPCQIAGATVMITSFIVSLAFIPSIGLGIPASSYAADSSYLLPIFDSLEVHMNETLPLSVGLVIEHLDLGSPSRLSQLLDQVITPILGRDDVYAVSCFAEQYAYYVEGALAAGVAVLPWGEWLMQPLGSQALPLRYVSFGSQLNEAVELGYDSGEVVPQSIGCSVAILQPSNNADERLAQATFLQDLAHYARLRLPAKVHIYSHSFAEAVSNDQEIVKNIIITIIVALCAVSLVLLLALPITRAIITTVNIGLVVLNLLGFMGYSGITFNPISFCTLTMAIGFCVDYTVELMHFSSSAGAGKTMADKMQSAIVACGYDVGHGCATAFIGVLLVSSVPGEAFRIFGYLAMVMCAYGGSYALWCLPSMMILYDDLMRWVLGRGGALQSWGGEPAVHEVAAKEVPADDLVAISLD